MGTGRFSQNYQTPTGSVPNSSFWAFNGEGALGIRDDRSSTTIRAAHYGGEFHLLETTGPEIGDPEGRRWNASNDGARWRRDGAAPPQARSPVRTLMPSVRVQ
jgi:hypothetical protein